MRGWDLAALCALVPLGTAFYAELDAFLAGRSEMSGRAHKKFPTNGLDKRGLKGWLQYNLLAPRSEADLARTFTEFDADADGRVAFAEVEQEMRQRFAQQAAASDPTNGEVTDVIIDTDATKIVTKLKNRQLGASGVMYELMEALGCGQDPSKRFEKEFCGEDSTRKFDAETATKVMEKISGIAAEVKDLKGKFWNKRKGEWREVGVSSDKCPFYFVARDLHDTFTVQNIVRILENVFPKVPAHVQQAVVKALDEIAKLDVVTKNTHNSVATNVLAVYKRLNAKTTDKASGIQALAWLDVDDVGRL